MNYHKSTSKAEYFGALSIGEYLESYADSLRQHLEQLPREPLVKVAELLRTVAASGNTVYVAGNGGSAAIAQHLACDWMKGTWTPEVPPIKIKTLGTNQSLLTAIANDLGYENSFSAELDMLAVPGDVAILISSSGNSANILSTAEVAKSKKLTTVGLTGFDGGKLREMVDVSLHIPFKNYGVVEDIHQVLMHVIAQFVYLSRK
jgi:phosphoheptose isomerase